MQYRLRDVSSDISAATEASGSLKELSVQPNVGVKQPLIWAPPR